MGATKSERRRKSDRIGLRTSEHQQALLRAASEAEGTTLSDFVLRHATRAAENLLADRRVFVLSSESSAEFEAMLDRPERDTPKLRELLNSPTILD